MEAGRPPSYGRPMSTLHIEHAITDYGTWRSAFDALAGVRRDAGVTAERIAQPIDDPHRIVIDLEFGSSGEATAFLSFLHEHVWATPEASPALAGRPQAAVYEPAPEPSSNR
jgi:hypothetical protein